MEHITEPMQSEDIGKLMMALSKAQGELHGASKSADNPFFKSKYADLHECIQAAKQPLAKNELAVVQTMEPCDDGIMIVTTLGHSSGQWIRGKIKMKPKKDDDQGRGSSITYGRRYSFAAIVGLAQKDDDGNDSCKGDKKTVQSKDTKSKEEKFFDQWYSWIDTAGKTCKNIDEFDTTISGVSEHIAKFTGKYRSDISNLIEDIRKEFEVQSQPN